MRSLTLALVLLWSSAASASGLPESERTAEAKRWLAVAFIAEAGWADPKHAQAEADHRGIYHVLRRRWQRLKKRFPKLTFVKMVQNYVAAFDSRTEKAGRVRWLLSLQPGSDREPAGWPAHKAKWSVHRVWWEQAQERAARCIDGGRCRDPYPHAWHWGGDMDIPRACMVELRNVGTLNTFYSIDMDCRRKAIRRKVLRAREAAGR